MSGGKDVVTPSAPVVSSVRITTSAYGRPLPLIYGRTKVAVNVIWYNDFKSIAQESRQSSGGKGGGGDIVSTSYTYTVAMLQGLCEGPISSVPSLWVGKKKGVLSEFNFSSYPGDQTQVPFGFVSTNYPGEALAYRGTAYLACSVFQLGDSATLPNTAAEVVALLSGEGAGDITTGDVNTADVLEDVLTSTAHGAGMPVDKIGDMSQMRTYCQAAELLISPAYTSQEKCSEVVSRLAKIANVGIVYSEGLLKFVPYADQGLTANGATYVPDATPIYDLNDNDFIGGGNDPVKCFRKPTADAYNHVQGKCYNRSNEYNEEVVEAKDQANIELTGLRTMSPLTLQEICETEVARRVVQQVLQHVCYVRNVYEFTLPIRYSLLEPMDIVNISDPGLGLVSASVRITQIEENENGDLLIKADEFPQGSLGASKYPAQSGGGFANNLNVAAGPVNEPVIFEPPVWLAGAPELWLAISGGENWGGCNVWVSDDGDTYQRVGVFNEQSRHGELTASIVAWDSPDEHNTLAIDLSVSRGTLEPGTTANATDLVTLCYVDGELIAYRDATLTGPYAYDLEYLVRGAYGTTIADHASGTQFARLDEAIFKYQYPADYRGRTLYIKLQSFNPYGAGIEDLSSITPIEYTILGRAFDFPQPENALVYCSPDASGNVTKAKISVSFANQFDLEPDGLIFMYSESAAPNGMNIVSGGTTSTLVFQTVGILAQSSATAPDFYVLAGSTRSRIVVRPDTQPLGITTNLAGQFWGQFGASEWRKCTGYDDTGFLFDPPFDIDATIGAALNWVQTAWYDERPGQYRLAWLTDGAGNYEVLRWGGIDQVGDVFHLTGCERGVEGTTPINADGKDITYFAAPGAGTTSIEIPLASFRQDESGAWVADFDVDINIAAGNWLNSLTCMVFRRRADTGLLRSQIVMVNYGGPL